MFGCGIWLGNVVLFFFSSRRRHTIFDCDWSFRRVLFRSPAIVKPATLTSYLTESVFHAMVESKILPAGSIQLLCGSAGTLLEHLDAQCAVAFTGSEIGRASCRERV